MAGLVRHTRARLRQCGRLCRTHQIMQCTLRLAEAAIDGKRARDVRRIAGVFGTGINQHQLAIAAFRHIVAIVQHTGICPRANNTGVRRLRAMFAKYVFQLGLQFELVHAHARRAQCRTMRLDTDICRLLHQAKLICRLEQAQLIQQMTQL